MSESVNGVTVRMSATNLTNGEDKTICGVCGQRYRVPRILPCLHTFCSACIANLQTYPANDEDSSSCDTDVTPDWLITPEAGEQNEVLLDDLEKSVPYMKPVLVSPDLRLRAPPRGRSKHAQLIERRLQRSKSCYVSNEDNSKKQGDVLDLSGKASLTRSVSTSGSKLGVNESGHSSKDAIATGPLQFKSEFTSMPKEKRRVVLCPLCLKEVKISNSLDELPRNFMIERLVAQEALFSVNSVLICDSCGVEDKDDDDAEEDSDEMESASSKTVTARCVECQENLCSLCEFSHRRQKRTKRHQLILVEQHHLPDSASTSSNSDSMSTIPESIDGELNGSETPSSSKRPTLLKNITRLKLPNLQQFGNLLWNPKSSEDKAKDENDKVHQSEIPIGISSENGGISNPAFINVNDLGGWEKATDYLYLRKNLDRHGEKSTGANKLRKAKLDRARPMSCLKHPEEDLKMFCIACEESVCRDCIVLHHRDHDCKLVSKELFQDQMEDVDNLIRQVIPKVEAVDDHLKSLTDTKVKVAERSETVKAEINGFVDTYIEAIEKHRNHLLNQVTSLADNKDRTLSVCQLHLRHMRSDVEQTCRFVAELLLGASDMEILSLKKLVTKRLTSLQNVAKEPPKKLNGFLRFCPTEKGEVIDNFQMFGKVVARQPCASKSFLQGDGLNTARISHTCVMVLTVCDTDGVPYHGSDVSLRAWIVFQELSIRHIPVALSPLKDGAYQVEFTPLYKGVHFLHVALNGQSVKDSPFKFTVKSRWRRHKGTWHCCTFCSTKGRKDVICGCGGTMKGGYMGCGHGHPGHPGGHHWSCCGKMSHNSECSVASSRSSPLRQVTL